MMDKTELRRIKRHLMSWSTGQFEVGPANQDSCSTIVVADPAHLADLLDTDLVGDNTVVLAPEGHGADPSRVVGFAGTLDEPNAEMSIGYDFFLQTQDYATSPFMSVLGPTLVRVTGPDDLELFLADADRAREEGVFPDIAVVPAVRIADLPGLGAGPGVDGPQLRLYVNAEGEISTSIGGCSLGRVGDTLASLRANWDRRNAASTAHGNCSPAPGSAATWPLSTACGCSPPAKSSDSASPGSASGSTPPSTTTPTRLTLPRPCCSGTTRADTSTNPPADAPSRSTWPPPQQ